MKCSIAMVVFFLGGIAQSLHAEQVQVWFTGTVTIIDDTIDAYAELSIGDPVSGYYIFETSTVDTNADLAIGNYLMSDDPSNNMTLTVGTTAFDPIASPQFKILVHDDLSGSLDQLIITNMFLMSGADPCLGISSLKLEDSSQTVFADDSLPTPPPDLNDYNLAVGSLVQYTDCGGTPTQAATLGFEIESISLQPVIPAVHAWSLVMMSALVAIAATVVLRRRQLGPS